MRRDDIRAMVKEYGRPGFVRVLADLLEGRDGAGTAVPKLDANRVSIRGLWEALVGPVDETLGDQLAGRFGYVDQALALQEAVDSTAFPSAVGVLVASKVIEGYDAPGMIGDQLVTIMPSKLKSERIVGFTALEGPQEVPENAPYPESSFEEKYVTTVTAKKGRILEISEETIVFDQTGQIILRAQRLGEMTAEERELIILGGVVDVGGAAGLTVNGITYRSVYRPQGTAEALYAAANNNLLATATPLVDWTDIDEVMRYHAETVTDDRAVSGEALPIVWMPKILLTARKLAGTAARIINATEVMSQPGAADATVRTTTGNPLTQLIPGFKALSSPLLDYLAARAGSAYDDSDDWFVGDFKKQFIWQEIWPIQTFRAFQDDDARFRRDILARFKVRYYGGIAAIDERHVIKVNAVT